MKEERKNLKIITRKEAFKITNNIEPLTMEELNNFSRKFNNNKEVYICRQKGHPLGDQVIRRYKRKYIIADICLIQ